MKLPLEAVPLGSCPGQLTSFSEPDRSCLPRRGPDHSGLHFVPSILATINL